MSENNIYEPPDADLDTDDNLRDKRSDLQKKKEKLLNISVVLTIFNIAVGFYRASRENLEGSTLLVGALSAPILALLLVGLSQIFPLLRNGYMRIQIYLWPTALFSLSSFVTVIFAVLTYASKA